VLIADKIRVFSSANERGLKALFLVTPAEVRARIENCTSARTLQCRAGARVDSVGRQSHCGASAVSELADKILIRRADSRNCDARRQSRASKNFIAASEKTPAAYDFSRSRPRVVVKSLLARLFCCAYFDVTSRGDVAQCAAQQKCCPEKIDAPGNF
jgi:hypothetical protein